MTRCAPLDPKPCLGRYVLGMLLALSCHRPVLMDIVGGTHIRLEQRFPTATEGSGRAVETTGSMQEDLRLYLTRWAEPVDVQQRGAIWDISLRSTDRRIREVFTARDLLSLTLLVQPTVEVAAQPEVALGASDACQFAHDGQCDEPDLCSEGTDSTDCRGAGPTAPIPESPCPYAGDGECDEPHLCLVGTDALDCSGIAAESDGSTFEFSQFTLGRSGQSLVLSPQEGLRLDSSLGADRVITGVRFELDDMVIGELADVELRDDGSLVVPLADDAPAIVRAVIHVEALKAAGALNQIEARTVDGSDALPGESKLPW